MADIFEKATRQKLRFESNKGALSTEDLWSLPLTSAGGTSLDDIARQLYKQLKSGDDVSFVLKEQKSDERIQLKFDVVKHIIDVKLEEADSAKKEKELADRKQLILGIIAEKENDNLKNMPIDELKKLITGM